MNWISYVFLILTIMGTLYYLLSTLALVALFRGKRITRAPDAPLKVSVLKPVNGIDRDARVNFASYLVQDYPDYEVLFGTLEMYDPAIEVILETIQGNKHASLHIGSTIRGANNKVRVLHQLAKHADGEIIIITDADTRVEPDFISTITAPFKDEKVGVVTCLYKGVLASGKADALEGLHMTCIFAPGVACARSLGGIDFGLGAAIAVRSRALQAIGGFEPIADYLADDFQLGRRPARLGYKVELSKYVIDEVLSGEGLNSVLTRELRWSRTTCVSRPIGHLGLIFTFGLAYAFLFIFVSGFSILSLKVLGCVCAIRLITAYVSARQCLRDEEFIKRVYLLPLRDLLSFGIWIAGYFGRTVSWRGRKLRIMLGGKMAKV